MKQMRTGCGTLFLLLMLGVVLVPSIALDYAGVVTSGTVLAKHEAINSDSEDVDWRRSLTIDVRYHPPHAAAPIEAALKVDERTYDQLQPGANVPVRYLPQLPEWSEHADQPRTSWTWAVRIALVGGVLLVLPQLPRLIEGRTFLTRRRVWLLSFAVSIIAMLFASGQAVLNGILPSQGGATQQATAVVREVERVTDWHEVDRRSRSSQRDGAERHLLMPYDRVHLEWTPPGMQQAVISVDEIDPDSVPNIAVGQTLETNYLPDHPRVATIIGARRNHVWINKLGYWAWLAVPTLVVLLGSLPVVQRVLAKARGHQTQQQPM